MTPFLRWAGGKTRVLPRIIPLIPKPIVGTYREIFVGGGAVFFDLADREGFQLAKLSDINLELINAYRIVQQCADDLLALLTEHASRNCERYYYEVRAATGDDATWSAARFIYLNKACFNGLHRVNAAGLFNVPWGKRKNPNIADEETILACSRALRGVELECCGFETALAQAGPGDFVYADPPYLDPDPKAFTGYSGRFTHAHAQALSDAMLAAQSRGVAGLISNADNELTRDAFEFYAGGLKSGPRRRIISLDVQRSVGASAITRTTAPEILVECPAL